MAKGGGITLASQAAKFLIRTVTVAILARLLEPGDFGLVALVTVAVGVIELFKDGGLSMATIQKAEITNAQVSSLFWINAALGAAIMLIEMALAPIIASFYSEPRLLLITVALAPTALIGGFAVQHIALLRRGMKFGRLALVEIFSIVIGSATAITMAFAGFSYWALVGMTIGQAIALALFSYALCPWRPRRPSFTSDVGGMVRFGSNLAGANVLNYLTRNADSFLIGLALGTAALGIYNRAHSMFLMPLNQFLSPISSVVIPALARSRDDLTTFRSIVLEKSYFVIVCVVGLTGFSFAAAPELVRVLLGSGWEGAVPVLRALSVGGAIYGTNIAGGWVSTTLGWSHRQLRVAVLAAPLYITAYIIGVQFSIVGVAAAFSITCAVLRYPVFRYLLKDSPISPGDLIWPLLKIGATATVCTFLAIAAGQLLTSGHFLLVLVFKLVIYALVMTTPFMMRLLPLPKISLKG